MPSTVGDGGDVAADGGQLRLDPQVGSGADAGEGGHLAGGGVGLGVFVGTAALHHSDLAGDVDALIVGIGAVTGNHDIVIGGGQIVRYVTVYLQERNVGVKPRKGGLAVGVLLHSKYTLTDGYSITFSVLS